MIPALFLVALVGVLTIVGLALASWSTLALAVYAVLVVNGALLAARRVRAQRAPSGRTCTCCTSTVYDPVEVR